MKNKTHPHCIMQKTKRYFLYQKIIKKSLTFLMKVKHTSELMLKKINKSKHEKTDPHCIRQKTKRENLFYIRRNLNTFHFLPFNPCPLCVFLSFFIIVYSCSHFPIHVSRYRIPFDRVFIVLKLFAQILQKSLETNISNSDMKNNLKNKMVPSPLIRNLYKFLQIHLSCLILKCTQGSVDK